MTDGYGTGRQVHQRIGQRNPALPAGVRCVRTTTGSHRSDRQAQTTGGG